MGIVKDGEQGLVISFSGEWASNKVQVAAFAGPSDGMGFAVDFCVVYAKDYEIVSDAEHTL